MNDFEKRLQVDEKVKYAIGKIEEAYSQQSRKMSEEDKEKTNRYLRKCFERKEEIENEK